MSNHPREHFSVEVKRSGESLITIESECYSGKADLTKEDEEVIRIAAYNLLGFIGLYPG